MAEAAEAKPVLLKRIDDLVIDKNKATGTFEVAGKPADDGEFEFILAVRVPSMDFSKNGTPPMVATLKPDVQVIVAEVKGIGDVPLANQKVQVVDPDSQEPVGDPVVADEKGKIVVLVPENKAFDLHIVDDDPGIDHPPHLDPNIKDGQDDRAFMFLQVVNPDGSPVAGEKLSLKSADGKTTHDDTTNDKGTIEVEVPPGVYEVSVKGKTLKASTLYFSDFAEEGGKPYSIIVPGDAPPPAQQKK